jgi:glycogen operon protein
MQTTQLKPAKKRLTVYTGSPYPLGATWDGAGVNFALYADNASHIELCLFDSTADEIESYRIKTYRAYAPRMACILPELKPGQLYGYRVHGNYDPQNGHRFNPNKLLIDPYAKAIAGTIDWDDSLFGYEVEAPTKILVLAKPTALHLSLNAS